ncbi:hypothetical protein AB0F46_35275 [Streptomyces sp. NPDC026665]|uniref:hypothetical protein n=1 Tax=Streptomyces sp. NPDC026665 TaxID=3154798 RepID=UPI003407AA96
MSDNVPTPPLAAPMPAGVEEAFRGRHRALAEQQRQVVAERDDRTRVHIKATIEALKEVSPSELAQPAGLFISGMLTGLASSVEILGGGTAEQALETVNTRLSAAIGEAYLAGNLPAQAPGAPAAAAAPGQDVRGVQGSLALDLHQALGLDVDDTTEHQGYASWADWWASLCACVAQRTRAEQAHSRRRAPLEDLSGDKSWDWRALQQGLRPDPDDVFHPISYGAVRVEGKPFSPGDPAYVVDLSGYTAGDPLYEMVRRLIIHRSLITALVRDLAGLHQSPEQARPVDWEAIARQREAELKTAGETKQAVEQERDGAYRERTRLEALIAAMTDGSVVAPAPDVDEPGWQILYITIGGRQASWHVSPRDADLVADIEHVAADDPRAQWDGHTTDEKYAHIEACVTALLQTCGPACAEGHTYTGRCEAAPDAQQLGEPADMRKGT